MEKIMWVIVFRYHVLLDPEFPLVDERFVVMAISAFVR